MFRIPIFGKVLLAFFGAMIIITVIAVLDLRSTSRVVQAYQNVEHSQQVINQLELVISLLKDGETGQRGYIITQNAVFLEPFTLAMNHIDQELARLDTLLAERPRQTANVTQLNQLVVAKIDFMHYTNRLVGQGNAEEAIQQVSAGTGKAIMDEVRRRVQQMKNIEEEVLDNFSRQVKDSYLINQWVVYVGILIIASIMLLGAIKLYQDLRQQAALRTDLQQTNEKLNHTVSSLNHANEELQTLNEALHAANATVLNYNQQMEKRSDELEQLNGELKEANKALEAFSYSISHDLLSPMRSVTGYSEMLSESYHAQLDAEGQRLIGKITTNARRMNQLIHGLLDFSRIGRKGMAKVTFSMEKLVVPILEEYREAYHPKYPVDIELHPLPAIHAEPDLIKQVWINLISNAFKFSSKVIQPAVEIGYQDEEHAYCFYIKDNGAGFDMKYAEKKLFGVFQRMHTQDEFEGTGVGLAIVQRIIENHNGSIWAEAAPDQGATFYFTLPKYTV